MTTLIISSHAKQRYVERVEPSLSLALAGRHLRRFVAVGRARPKPRHWMARAHSSPGTRFIYWSKRPGVCAIVRNGVVVTVLTADLCHAAPHRHPRGARAKNRRPQPAERRRCRDSASWLKEGLDDTADAA